MGEDPQRELVLLRAVQFETEVPQGKKLRSSGALTPPHPLEKLFELDVLLSPSWKEAQFPNFPSVVITAA